MTLVIQPLDTAIFHAVNAYAGNGFLDSLADFEEKVMLLKGGLFAALYCWLWFDVRERQPAQCQNVIAMLLASFVALFLARSLAHIVPFRVRPMYGDALFHPTSFPVAPDFETWSSFPSDHAAMFFCLAMGAFLIRRGVGAFLLIYTAFWICLPRIYLGVHYPSDLAAGALVGLASAMLLWFLAATDGFARWIGRPLLHLERKYPGLFYALGFCLLFELAGMFWDIRYGMHHVDFLFRLAKHALLWAIVLGLVSLAAVWLWKHRSGEKHRIAALPRSRRGSVEA